MEPAHFGSKQACQGQETSVMPDQHQHKRHVSTSTKDKLSVSLDHSALPEIRFRLMHSPAKNNHFENMQRNIYLIGCNGVQITYQNWTCSRDKRLIASRGKCRSHRC